MKCSESMKACLCSTSMFCQREYQTGIITIQQNDKPTKLHMMFCSSFSFILLTIVFCPYFVLSKVRNLSVGTLLQWIHFYCGSEVNLVHDATLSVGIYSPNRSLSHFLQMYSLDVGIENLLDSASTKQYCQSYTLILLKMIHCDLGISVLWQHVHRQ